MSDISNDDKPGFLAVKPEHCCACCRLTHPDQTHHLTIENMGRCENRAPSEWQLRRPRSDSDKEEKLPSKRMPRLGATPPGARVLQCAQSWRVK